MKLTRAGFKTAFLLLVLTFILNLAAFAAQSDAKALFDRYQAVYKSYREAVENQADAAEVVNPPPSCRRPAKNIIIQLV